jgi:outer membrane receptor protein involved in Fe transport
MKKALWHLAALLAMSSAAFGQSQNGSISGIVTDPSGAVVANAKVTVTSVQTNAVRSTVSGSSGAYTVQGLIPQDYTVTVEAPGFAATTTKLNVAVGSANTANVKLSVSGASTVVEVAANALVGIDLENAENSQVISNQQITEFPTESRDPYSLVSISGSVSSDPSAASRGVGFNISGARSSSTEILLDGIENTYLFSVSVATTVPLDAVQEFRVITSNFAPEYGRASGGVVNVVTKSGTNAFHGTAYEFYRPSTFASNSYFNNANGIPLHRFVRNNYGYSLGGPVVKNKLFFFSSTEWLKVRSSNVTQYLIPTTQFIAASNANTQGFFSKFGKVSGAATSKILTLGQIGGAPGSVSSAFSTDRTALEASFPSVFNDNFPMLQQVNVTSFADAGGGTPQDTYNTIERGDWTISDRTQVYGRYVLYNQVTPLGSGNLSPYAGFSTVTSNKAQNLVVGITHNFSSSLTSQIQFGGMRDNVNQPLGANPAGPTLFINSGAAPSVANNSLVFPGYSEGNAGNGIPSGGPQNNIVISPIVTWTKGRHTFTFGGQYTYIRDNHTFAIYENAQESLVSSGTQGSLVNFQAGVFNFFQANLDPQGKYPCVKDLVTGVVNTIPACTIVTPIAQPNFSRSNRYNEGAGFFDDAWKVVPRLTVDLGIRYDLYGTQHNKHHELDSNFYFGTTGTLQDRLRAGKIMKAIDQPISGVQDPGGKLWATNYKQFGPRIGFAYDLTGDGKTSIRGGYGISYERNFGNVTYNVALNPPSQLAISFTNLDVGASIPINTVPLGSFSGGSGVSKAIPPGTVRAVDPKIKPAYAQFYTLALEREFSKNFSAGASFTGTRGIHNYSIANYNRSYYGPVYENDPLKYVPSGAKNSNRLNPQFTSINVRGADGDSYYSGINTYFRGSNLFNTGLIATGNYTYSHSTDNTSSAFTDGQSNGDVGGVAYFDPYNHAIDHGNSDFDVKHRISTSILWDIKYADRLNSFAAREVMGGWEIGTVFSANTGTPFTMYDCNPNAITACGRARFLQTPHYQRSGPAVPTATPDLFAYITFPAYSASAYGTYGDPKEGAVDLPTIVGGVDTFPGGMSARNAFRGPGQFIFNLDVNKSIKINERMSVQLRGEAYNILNHANSYLVLSGANDVANTPYAQIQKNGPGAGANRQLQLAGKFIF